LSGLHLPPGELLQKWQITDQRHVCGFIVAVKGLRVLWPSVKDEEIMHEKVSSFGAFGYWW
jgi:hypothetical protein